MDESAFLLWETSEQDSPRRILRPPTGVVPVPTSVGGTESALVDGAAGKGEPIDLWSFRESGYPVSVQKVDSALTEDSSGPDRVVVVGSWIPEVAADVTQEEVMLSVVKREARRRAQRDLYILMVYRHGEHAMFSGGQVEGMLKAAGIDTALPTGQLLLS